MTEKTIQIYNSSEDEEIQENQDLRHLLHYLQDEHNQRKDGIAPPYSNINTTMVKPPKKQTVGEGAVYDNDEGRLDTEASLVDQNQKQMKREISQLEETKRKRNATPFTNQWQLIKNQGLITLR